MRENIDVHGTKARYDRAIHALKADKNISDHNRKVILRFVWELQAEGIGLKRILKYLYLLPRISKGIRKDFEKATTNDIKHFLAEVNQSKYADWTKQDYRVGLKRFYRWLKALPNDQDPPETAWIRIGGQNGKRILPEELLTEDDIQKMLGVSESSRDRALLLTIFETGGRVAEVLNLRRKHVQFDANGAVVNFSGKTGDRRDRVCVCAPALAQWMNDHPSKEPDSPLWVVTGDKGHGEPLLYDGARFLLRRLARSAGIQKRINPHSFRHARATSLASILTERQMEQYLGWRPGSKMPKVYVHLSGRDVDEAILKANGIEVVTQKQAKPKLAPTKCPRCQQTNDSLVRFCSKCGLPLKLEAALELEDSRKEADTWLNILLGDMEFKEFLQRKLREIISSQMRRDVLPVQHPPEPPEPNRAKEEPTGAAVKPLPKLLTQTS